MKTKLFVLAALFRESQQTQSTCTGGQIWDTVDAACADCPAGETWDAASDACGCPAGETWDAVDSTCTGDVCNGGEGVWNATDGVCGCNGNSIWDSSTNVCECPTGEVLNIADGDGQCSCPSGETWTEVDSVWVCDGTITCPGDGEVWNLVSQVCECPTGQSWNTDSATCECPSGQIWDADANDGNGQCELITCPGDGEIYDVDSATCVCPTDQYWCFTDQMCKCPSGQVWDAVSTTCTGTISCPATGEEWSSSTNTCNCPYGTLLDTENDTCEDVDLSGAWSSFETMISFNNDDPTSVKCDVNDDCTTGQKCGLWTHNSETTYYCVEQENCGTYGRLDDDTNQTAFEELWSIQCDVTDQTLAADFHELIEADILRFDNYLENVLELSEYARAHIRYDPFGDDLWYVSYEPIRRNELVWTFFNDVNESVFLAEWMAANTEAQVTPAGCATESPECGPITWGEDTDVYSVCGTGTVAWDRTYEVLGCYPEADCYTRGGVIPGSPKESEYKLRCDALRLITSAAIAVTVALQL